MLRFLYEENFNFPLSWLIFAQMIYQQQHNEAWRKQKKYAGKVNGNWSKHNAREIKAKAIRSVKERKKFRSNDIEN